MGGTLPVLARYLIQRHGDVGRQTGTLYFFNTLGAVLGCCVAGFFLIEHLGLRASTYVAAGLNFGLAGLALALHVWMPPKVPKKAAEIATKVVESYQPIALSAKAVRLVVICIGVSGFISLASEVLWARALPRYIYNSTYAYTTILAVFLLGLALGSFIYLFIPFRKSHPVLIFAALEAGAALGLVLALHLFPNLREASAFVLGEQVATFGDSVVLMVVRGGLILFLPAVCFGATIPLVTQMCARGIEGVGGLVGRIYAVNTVGAVLGSLGVTFVLVPTIGMYRTAIVFVVGLFLMAISLACAGLGKTRDRLVALAVLVPVAFAATLTLPSDVFRKTFGRMGDKVLFYEDGVTDTVAVLENAVSGARVIQYGDNRGTASTGTFPWNFMFGHLPALLHPGEPKYGLHICFGVGNSLSAMAATDSIERVDSVELSPHVLDAAQFFWTNNDVLSDPKIRTIIDDGRNYVMATRETYDVIELEPPAIFTAGVVNLYTRDFYEDIYARLADDGVFVQWMPSGNGDMVAEQMLLRAFHEVFPHGTIWIQLTRESPILAVGTKRPLQIDFQLLNEKMNRPRVEEDLRLASIRTAVDLLSMFLFGPDELAEYVKDVHPVTDDKTVVDFTMPKDLASGFGLFPIYMLEQFGVGAFLSANEENVVRLIGMKTSILPYLTNLGAARPQRLEQRILEKPLPKINMVGTSLMKESDWNRWVDTP